MHTDDRENHAGRGFIRGRMPIAGFLVVMLVISTLGGCAGLHQSMAENPGRSAALCAGGGALGGAALGALVDHGNVLRGALIGALAGALAGGAACFAVAKFSSTPIKDYQQTQAETGYLPTQGTVVRVDSFRVDPGTVSAGQKLTFSGEYYVMTPDQNADLPVVESMIVSFYDDKTRQWREVGRTQNPVTIKPGKRRIDPAEITAPQEPPAPRILVALQVDHQQISDQKSQGVVIMASRQASFPAGVGWTAFAMPSEEIRGATAR
jgi:hypothetical protein